MQPTFDMLCLTCPCHHRNYQLSASWQDYGYKLLTAETISIFGGVHWVHIRASEKHWNLPTKNILLEKNNSAICAEILGKQIWTT